MPLYRHEQSFVQSETQMRWWDLDVAQSLAVTPEAICVTFMQ